LFRSPLHPSTLSPLHFFSPVHPFTPSSLHPYLFAGNRMDQLMALDILGLFDETDAEGWDLHAFFELVAGDDQARRIAVLDTVDRLVEYGYLENRGSDFYTLTEKGMKAAIRGHLDEW